MSLTTNGASSPTPPHEMPSPKKAQGSSSFPREIIKGGVLGAFVIGACNPIIYCSNMLLGGQVPVLKHCFSGVALNSLNVIPQTAIQMAWSRLLMNQFFPDHSQKKPSFFCEVAIAALAGAISSVATTPGELLVYQCQRLSGKNPSLKKNAWLREADLIMQIAKDIFRAGGWNRFAAGMTAVGAREAAWAITYIVLAPTCIKWYKQDHEDNLWDEIKGAGTAGAIGGIVTNPFQFLRIQKQIHALDPSPLPSYVCIIQTAGLKKLLVTGVHARAAAVATACILMTMGKKALYE